MHLFLVALLQMPDPEVATGDFLRLLLENVKAGRWDLVAALAVVALVVLARRFLAKKWPVLATAKGMAVLGALLAAGGGLVNALLVPGATLTPALLLAVLGVLVKSGIVGMLVREFIAAPKVAEAEKAGALAVAAKPSGGLDGLGGRVE